MESSKRHNVFKLGKETFIEQWKDDMPLHGTMFLEAHLLLFVMSGNMSLRYGSQTYKLSSRQMVLLKKATLVQYQREQNEDFSCLLFFLYDDVLRDFLASAEMDFPRPQSGKLIDSTVYPIDDCLVAFTVSLMPYFSVDAKAYSGQVRLKMMELLYDVSHNRSDMFCQILQLHQPIRADIRRVVEQNYTSPVGLENLAYLSGRSLSSFKRDFQQIYNVPPAKWIREKRLAKAKELLQSTQIPIADICFSLGFENLSHFSRIFKEHYGKTPMEVRTDS